MKKLAILLLPQKKQGELTMNTNRKWTSSACLRLLTAILLCCMLLGLCAHALAGETYFNSHWMSYIPDYVPISQINTPGTHDTGTYRTAHVFGDYMAECQEWTIRGQLYEGIRVLDIRLLGDSSWEEMKIRHGEGPIKGCNFYKGKDSCDKTYLRFKHVFEVVDAFLAANPTETIIMYATDEDDKEMAQARLRELSQKLKHDRPWDPAQKWNRFRWYFFGDDVPTLGEVRGQCVIISDCYFDGGNRIRPFTKFEDHC